MNADYCIVLCTVPDQGSGERLARSLVDARLAACVNLLPGVTSVFRWQDEVQKETEALLIMKTRRDRFAALCTAVHAQHPYELPEIIAVPLSDGLPAYLRWIDQSLETPT